MIRIGVHVPYDESEVELLAIITAGFPDYRIWRATTSARSQYVAQAVDLTAHPHTLVTSSLAELRTELTSAQAEATSGDDRPAPDLADSATCPRSGGVAIVNIGPVLGGSHRAETVSRRVPRGAIAPIRAGRTITAKGIVIPSQIRQRVDHLQALTLGFLLTGSAQYEVLAAVLDPGHTAVPAA